MSTERLTPRQADYLDALAALRDYCGYPPSIRDVARRLGVSHTAAAQALRTLRKLGCVDWEAGSGVKGNQRTLHRVEPRASALVAAARGQRLAWPQGATAFR